MVKIQTLVVAEHGNQTVPYMMNERLAVGNHE